jgi:hypothetical protein
MDTSDVIAAVAAGIALVAIVPAVLAWLEARHQTSLAKTQAENAARDAGLAEERATAATKAATAAEEEVVALRDQIDVARGHAVTAAEHAIAAARSAGAAEATQRAQAKRLLFDVDRALADFDDVHQALRASPPRWFAPGEEDEPSKWVRVERYMGTFERVQVLVAAELLPIELVEELYGYRVSNLVNDPLIYREKLVKRADGWKRFIDLWRDLDEASRRRTSRPLSPNRSPAQRDRDERKADDAREARAAAAAASSKAANPRSRP